MTAASGPSHLGCPIGKWLTTFDMGPRICRGPGRAANRNLVRWLCAPAPNAAGSFLGTWRKHLSDAAAPQARLRGPLMSEPQRFALIAAERLLSWFSRSAGARIRLSEGSLRLRPRLLLQ